MASGRRAYFIDEQRFTPSQFQRLARARKVEAMVQWFQARFTDPAHETPYNGREGGYQYINGGPFDSNEEIQTEFSDIAEYEAMEQAVDEVTSDGTLEWAPIRGDPEYEDQDDDDGIASLDQPLPDWAFDPPEDEEDEEDESTGRDLRLEVLASLDRFEAKLDAYAAQRAHRGHNQPPELVDDEDPLTDADLIGGRDAVAAIRAEADKEEPDAGLVARAAATIASLGRKLWTGAKFLGAAIVGNAAYDGIL